MEDPFKSSSITARKASRDCHRLVTVGASDISVKEESDQQSEHHGGGGCCKDALSLPIHIELTYRVSETATANMSRSLRFGFGSYLSLREETSAPVGLSWERSWSLNASGPA